MLAYVAFIEAGKVDVLVNDVHVAEMGDGSYLGEISALGLGINAAGDSTSAVATATVRATQYCTVHVLPKLDFVAIMRQFPDVLSAVHAVAQLRLARASISKQDDHSVSSPEAAQRRKQAVACCAQMNALTDEDVHKYLSQQAEEQAAQERERKERLSTCAGREPTARPGSPRAHRRGSPGSPRKHRRGSTDFKGVGLFKSVVLEAVRRKDTTGVDVSVCSVGDASDASRSSELPSERIHRLQDIFLRSSTMLRPSHVSTVSASAPLDEARDANAAPAAAQTPLEGDKAACAKSQKPDAHVRFVIEDQ